MSAPKRRRIWLLLVSLFLLIGLSALWAAWKFYPREDAASADNSPPELAAVQVPHRPQVLAWSSDGNYIAAGAWGWGDASKKADPSEVYVVDVAKGTVAATLKATGMIQAV